MLAELEFEHGTEEIALETALLDFELHSAFNFRAGIILPQIGMFNVNHDSPKWQIIDRPLVSTTIIPSTLSEVGFGAYGKFYHGNNTFTYDFYVVNGLQDGVILNEDGRTSIPSGKDEEMFGEDNNGTPMLNGRFAVKNRKYGEYGLSYYGGVYNSFAIEGEPVSEKRSLSLMAFDFSVNIFKATLQGEIVAALIDVPVELDQFYGSRQQGGFVELIYPVLKRKMLGFDKSVLNVALRLEYVDYNVGTFEVTEQNIGESLSALVLGLGYSPRPGTIVKANYRRHLTTDLLGNPPVILGGFQFGVATYF